MVKTNTALIKKAYDAGLTIYAILNEFRKVMDYDMPESAIKMTCEAFLKQRPKIKNEWAWFLRVLKAKRDEVNALREVARSKKLNKANPTLIKEIFRRIGNDR